MLAGCPGPARRSVRGRRWARQPRHSARSRAALRTATDLQSSAAAARAQQPWIAPACLGPLLATAGLPAVAPWPWLHAPSVSGAAEALKTLAACDRCMAVFRRSSRCRAALAFQPPSLRLAFTGPTKAEQLCMLVYIMLRAWPLNSPISITKGGAALPKRSPLPNDCRPANHQRLLQLPHPTVHCASCAHCCTQRIPGGCRCGIRRRQPGCRRPPPAASAALLFPWRLQA